MKFLLLCIRYVVLSLLAGGLYDAGCYAAAPASLADGQPDPKIQFQVLLDGKPMVGANEVAAQVKFDKSLTPAQTAQVDRVFDEIVVPFKRGASIPFIVNLKQPDGSWKNVTSDPRLNVYATLEALTFDHTEELVARAPTGMLELVPGMIVTIYVGFVPNLREPKIFGFNEYYVKAVE